MQLPLNKAQELMNHTYKSAVLSIATQHQFLVDFLKLASLFRENVYALFCGTFCNFGYSNGELGLRMYTSLDCILDILCFCVVGNIYLFNVLGSLDKLQVGYSSKLRSLKDCETNRTIPYKNLEASLTQMCELHIKGCLPSKKPITNVRA